MKKYTGQQMKDLLAEHGCYTDKVIVREGVYKAFWGFFYRQGGDEYSCLTQVEGALFRAQVPCRIEELNKPFVGGAPVNKQSHWWVEFRVNDR